MSALDIAGFRAGFGPERGRLVSLLRRRYRRFLVSGGSASLDNSFAGPRPFEALAKKDGTTLNFIADEVSGGIFPFRPAVSLRGDKLEIRRGDFKATLDLGTGSGKLAAAPNGQCLDAFLRALTSFLLIRSGGFMLHSAGIIRKGKAYLFPGRSGAGKSTLAALAASGGVEVISDELNLVRFEKGRFMVYGSPFWGEMRNGGRPGAWPLGGVFLLKKAEMNRLSPCSKPEALKLLLRCLVNFSRDPEDAALALENSARLLSKTRFSGLDFSKDNADFLNFV